MSHLDQTLVEESHLSASQKSSDFPVEIAASSALACGMEDALKLWRACGIPMTGRCPAARNCTRGLWPGGSAQARGYQSHICVLLPGELIDRGTAPRPAAPRPFRTAVDDVGDVPGSSKVPTSKRDHPSMPKLVAATLWMCLAQSRSAPYSASTKFS